MALLVCYLLVVGLIGARLITVQVVAAEEYRTLGERQTQREVTLPAARGRLYDRTGSPLAITQTAAAVYADPRVLAEADADARTVAEELAGLLDADAEALAERLTADAGFVYLARQVPYAVGERVREARLPGVGVLDEPLRRYPGGSLAASVLGFAGIDDRGLAGLELQHDEVLTGEPGTLQIERAPGGVPIHAAARQGEPAIAGSDLVLTLDRRIQHAAEDVLADALESYDATAGAAVVLDARTAEVLAMASAPGFDLDDVGEVPVEERRNRPVTDAFEPGSVAKVITAAWALEHGVVRPDQTLHLPASIDVGGKSFRDPRRSRDTTVTFAEAMAASSNVGAIRVAERLEAEALHEGYASFGFGEPTGLAFPGSTSGALPPVEQWWATSLPTIAIGQGTSASLLHVASVLQTVANQGERVTPSLVRGKVDSGGQLQPAAAADRRRVVSPETAGQVTEILTGVVDEGTGRRAAVDGYRVAGKTGTAQKPDGARGGYAEDAYVATFAGFAPADDPEVVVAIMLDEPEPIWGGETAAPAFAALTERALTARRVSPQLAESDADASDGDDVGAGVPPAEP